MAEPHPADRFTLAIDPNGPPPGLEGAVIAVGNFDGMHRGHRTVIARAEAIAARLGRPCAVLTFEPHPIDYFRGPGTVFRLMPLETKAEALRRLGLDGMIVLSFDAAMAALPAEEFVTGILVARLKATAVVAGHDFHFGKGRGGSPAFLKDAGARHGFLVEIVEPVALDRDAEPASSTATRAALEAGDVAKAADILGHAYAVRGAVVSGERLGRTLGFPTANLRLDPSCRLRHGIYAVRVTVGDTVHDGVASFGRRPTFDNGAPLLESFLFDFSGDLYGQTIEVAFIDWIRAEAKFDSVEALVAEMNRDAARARELLAARALSSQMDSSD